MKRNISFSKRVDFPTMVGEISAISLDTDLKFVDELTIEGNLILSGKYKITEASRLEEDFNYKLPVEISLTEKLDQETTNIEISNFTYELKDENIMICNIELLIEGLEIIEDDEDLRNTCEEVRECDGEAKETEIPIKEESIELLKKEDVKNEQIEIVEEKQVSQVNKEETTNIFNISDNTETYGTLLVYIIRENETINSIITKYKTTVEELEKYNDLKDLSIGTKLIIPISNE